MRPSPAGATGRYTPACEDGICSRAGGRVTSKLEGKIFTLLDYVLGLGQQGFNGVSRGRVRSADMLFPLHRTKALIVEYDGEYWHKLKPENDAEKTNAMIEGVDQFIDNLFVRIREHPLPKLGPFDVQVPQKPDALLCVRVTLLHLLHTAHRTLDDRVPRILDFLRSSPAPLIVDDLACPKCFKVARSEMPHLLADGYRERRWTATPRKPLVSPEPQPRLAPPVEKINNVVPRRPPIPLQLALPGMEKFGRVT